MKLQFVGVGAAIKTKYHGASAVVDDHILVDAPPACNMLLKKYDLTIDTVFITHLHGDHLVGLPFWLLERYVEGIDRDVHIYGPPGLEKKIRDYFAVTFTDMDIVRYPILGQTYFHSVVPGETLDLGDVHVTPVEGQHAITSYGYIFTTDHASIYFSGDTELCLSVLSAIDQAGCVVFEGTKKEGKLDTHTTLEELIPIIRSYPDKEFYITHRQDYSTDDITENNIHFPEEGDVFNIRTNRP